MPRINSWHWYSPSNRLCGKADAMYQEAKAFHIDKELTFEDNQNLQYIRQSLLKALSALKGSLTVALGCKKYYELLHQKQASAVSESSLEAFEMLQVKFQGHLDTIERLLGQIDGVSRMVNDPAAGGY